MSGPLRRMSPATVTRELYESLEEAMPGPLARMSKQSTLRRLGLDPLRAWSGEAERTISS